MLDDDFEMELGQRNVENFEKIKGIFYENGTKNVKTIFS